MNNLIAFINAFLSYLLVFGVTILVVAVAIFIGITTRKSKNAKEALEAQTEENKDATVEA